MAEQAPPPHPRILYIEDNPESRTLVRKVLEARGFDVLEASDGIAGIDLAISAHPDLILCDIEMPGIDGYETATRLRSYRGLDQCPIVVLTSHGDRGLSLSIGCDGYIEKPIDVARFPGQLREFLKGKREKVRGPEERRYLREYSQSLVERLEAAALELTAEPTDPGWGDERKLKQAVGNLIDNAIKFSPHGSSVLLRVSGDALRLDFEVYDQGEGLLADEAEKVFDPFFHADRVGDERAPGAGLGLPVAKQVVEAHGGHIWAESPPKNQPDSRHHFSGAKVAFWIPARAHAPDQPQETAFPEHLPEGGTS